GPKSDEIWNYYNKGQEKNDGHYSATCYYCSKTWARGKPAKLKAHLANECLPCPPDINHFGSKKPLPLSVTERIDHALLKAWFEAKLSPYDLPYVEEMDTPELWWGSIKNKPSHLSEIAIRLFGITPTQSNCGRNFSTLKWIIGDRRTRLAIQRLEYFKN
ncbi:16393_t:CDS:2, partial [Entrophospora sp. SA101]